MLNDFFNLIGVKSADIIAGFSGGVARVAIFGSPATGPWGAVGAIIAGTLTATFLGPVAPTYLGLKPSQAITFLVGLAGMEICQRIMWAITRWSPAIKKGSGDDV